MNPAPGSTPNRGAGVLQRALLAWYRRTARKLPWRETRDPYRIWLSETMLQQTRVETVLPYYARFVGTYPTVQALATAPLDRVLKLWEGLGYYTRARNLHRAAQIVAKERGGRLPRSADEWQRLPGIGRYTAGAIASIAQGEPVPAVDGNVKRVLARLFSVRTSIDTPATQARLWQIAQTLLPKRSPGDFNQALMELGARVCTPRTPHCQECPVQRGCAARAAGTERRLPIRSRRPSVPTIEAVAAVLRKNGRYLLVQRPATGLLAGLWTWPGGEVANGQAHPRVLRSHLLRTWGIDVLVGQRLATLRHEFSHRHLRLHVYACGLNRSPRRSTRRLRWIAPADFDRFALATLDRKVLEQVVSSDDDAGPSA